MKKYYALFAVMMLMLSGCGKSIDIDVPTTPVSIEDTPINNEDGSSEVTEGVGIQEVSIDGSEVNSADATTTLANGKLSALEEALGSIYFDFDSFLVKMSETTKLANNADKLKAVQNTADIKVEGNCDEWGSDEYNYALGLKRADSVKSALLQDGIAEKSILVISYGESNPVCTEHTEGCWAQNRRVDFKLLSKVQ